MELHQPRSVRETPARERDELRLTLAPARQCVRPLLRAAWLECLLAAGDHAAVDDAGHDWRYEVGRDPGHRLVHEPQAVFDRPLPDPSDALRVESDRGEVGVAEALGDLDRVGGSFECPFMVAGSLPLENERELEPTALHTIPSLSLDQPLGPAEPTTCRADLAPDRERRPQPARTPRSGEIVAVRKVHEVGALEQGQVLVHAPDE